MAGDYQEGYWAGIGTRDIVTDDLTTLLEVVSKAPDVALVAMFGIDGFDKIKELRGRYL
jgi:hypothetical protein